MTAPMRERAARLTLKYLPFKATLLPAIQRVGRYDRSVAFYYTSLNDLFLTVSKGNNNLHNAWYRSQDENYAQGQDNLTRLVGDTLGLEPGSHVLDVGCGLGGPAANLADWFGCRVTGVNVTAAQVRAAREFVGGRDLSGRVRFVVTDATRMELPARAFTHAMALASFSHMPDKPAVLGRVRDALGHGGGLAINDVSVPDLARLRRHPDFDFFAFMLGFPPSYLCTDDQMVDLLTGAGFEPIEVRDLTAGAYANPAATADWVRDHEGEVVRLYGRRTYALSLRLVDVVHDLATSGLVREQLWVSRRPHADG